MKPEILNKGTYKDSDRSVSQNFDSLSQEDKILSHTLFINSIARKLAMRLPPNILPEDLIGAGVIGLIDAINRFDPRKNVLFKIYARYRIEGAMWDELRALDWVPRPVRQKQALYKKVYQNLQNRRGEPAGDEEMAYKLGLTLSEYYSFINEINCLPSLDVENLNQNASQSEEENSVESIFEKEHDPFYIVSIREQKMALARAIDTLSQNEKTVISLYHYEGLTMKKIGEIMGLAESRVSQIHKKAVRNLKIKGSSKN